MDLALDGKVVFITGASGGIGRALAEAFGAEGARLALQAHTHERELAAFAAERWPGERALVLNADVADPAQIDAACDQALVRFGRIDVCIANAGIWSATLERLDEMPVERVQRTLAVNLYGAIWTARSFLRALARSGPHPAGHGASLIFIGSTAGRFGERGNADYAVSKAGLYGLVRSLKSEIVACDPYARVNMVEPGWTMTPMTQATLASPGAVLRAVRTMPVRQLARAADIARAALFLASPTAARHVSGEILTIAGGMEGRVLWDTGEVDVDRIRRRLEED